MADVRTIQSTPVAANFASNSGSPLLWDAAGLFAYMLGNGDVVIKMGGATTGSGLFVEQNNPQFTGYIDFVAIANPAGPAAGVARFHALTTNGFTRFEQDNEAPTNITIGRDNVFLGRNTSGSTIIAGKPVYVTGATGNVPNIALAKANAVATLPAVGVTLDAIASNAFGQIMKLGILAGIDTSAFASGDSLWVSAATAGALVNTRPASPSLAQRIASVLVSGVGNGALLIVTAPFVGGEESGTSVAWLAASTIKPAQATPNAYLSSDNSAGISTTVTSANLVGKTLTIKDGLVTGFA